MSHDNRVLDAARKYTRWGWRVVPIPAGEKGPRRKNWQKLRIDNADLARYFDEDGNIGVLLGEPSDGLVDVDLDSPEAVFIAPTYLPETGRIHGRSSKTNSHCLYYATPIPSPEKFCDLDGTCLLELRSNGQQTMVPPSLHPSGERVRWESNRQSAEVDAPELRTAVATVAAASLFARHWPAKGSRNHTALALAGMLLRAGWDATEVGEFVSIVARAAHDEQWRVRGPVARSTRGRLAEQRDATGRPRLSELLGADVVDRACKWLRLIPEEKMRVDTSPAPEEWPESLSDRAFQGLAGEIARTIEPETEADVAALLIQTLIGFGNAVGPGPFCMIEATHHRANLFGLLIGDTSKSRKGTSWGHVKRLLTLADPIWASDCHGSGMATGEGLVAAVQDPKPGKEESEASTLVPVVSDKRLLAYESEFSRVLRVARREGNILSALLRQAYDNGDLEVMTKTNPLRATGAHISVLGHITQDELKRELTASDEANGFANRFLFVCVRRSKELPFGGKIEPETIHTLGAKLRRAVNSARSVREVTLSDEARELWVDKYSALSAAMPGLLGAVTARAEAHVRRLSMVYALLDSTPVIQEEHLRAALAVWRYCFRSCRYIFGKSLGYPVADRILLELRTHAEGLTRNEIYNLFSRNLNEAAITPALSYLHQQGLAHSKQESTDGQGRPTERWVAGRRERH